MSRKKKLSVDIGAVKSARDCFEAVWKRAERIAPSQADLRASMPHLKKGSEKHVPTKPIDRMWHLHILHTQQYMTDCLSIFGYYLHHSPFTDEIQSPQESEDAIKLTEKLFVAHYGASPSKLATAFGIAPDEISYGLCSDSECGKKIHRSIPRKLRRLNHSFR